MPPGDYAQEKALKQEEKLIGQLERLELSSDLLNVLQDQVLLLLDGKLLKFLFTRVKDKTTFSLAPVLFYNALSATGVGVFGAD
jgi:hypothetical protein